MLKALDSPPSLPASGAPAPAPKRKRVADKFYAVQTGHRPGIYTSWKECLDQIRGFKGAKFKSFETKEEADLFVKGQDPSLNPDSDKYVPKFYGVRSGKVPGVYTDWASAQRQVVGVLKPKVRCFPTAEEAQAFVVSGANTSEETLEKSEPPPKGTKHIPDVLPETTEPPPAKKRRSSKAIPEVSLIEPILPPAPTPTTKGPPLPVAAPRKCSPPHDSKQPGVLRIYTDGSALANGTPRARAGVGVWFGDQDDRNISEPLQGSRQTNQRAELTAILRAINVAPIHREVLIFTDSQYSINCVTRWSVSWVQKNWRTTAGKPVENRDLVELILAKLKERDQYGSKTSFEWVKGHTGLNDGNSMADKLAVEGAMMDRNSGLI